MEHTTHRETLPTAIQNQKIPQPISFSPSVLVAVVDYYLDTLFHLGLQNGKYLTFIF